MGYLFRGQDRRDLNKSALGVRKILARDVLATNPKKTAAISTRRLVFDKPSPAGYLTTMATKLLAILTMKASLRRGTQAVFLTSVDTDTGCFGAIGIGDGGAIPS